MIGENVLIENSILADNGKCGMTAVMLDLLGEHHIEEDMPLCIEVMEIQKWGKRDRMTRCLRALDEHGAAAKPMLPRLGELEKDLLAHPEA